MVLEIHCSGTPYEIGHTHGSKATPEIKDCVAFYAGLFKKTAGLDWDAVKTTAMEFEPNIKAKWPYLLEEMQGIADGAGLELADIIGLNVRTEITFGLFTEGCTSLAWQTPETVYVCQNWDWMQEQKSNIILLDIEQKDLPNIKMLTEAGLVGKIGFNDAGVAICVNAIRAKGVDNAKLPMHLAMRVVLNSTSLDAAVHALERYGVASSCHLLVGDKTGAIGMEWSHVGVKIMPVTDGRIHHANHLLLEPHPGIVDTQWVPDSLLRTARIQELTGKVGKPTVASIQELFKDEKDLPGAICRKQVDGCASATLFNIIMDVVAKKAYVIMGRPTEPEEEFTVSF